MEEGPNLPLMTIRFTLRFCGALAEANINTYCLALPKVNLAYNAFVKKPQLDSVVYRRFYKDSRFFRRTDKRE